MNERELLGLVKQEARPPKYWMDRASCRGTNEVFEDESIGNFEYLTDTYCNNCPVLSECLSFAIANSEDGIWGATTRRIRVRLSAALTIADGNPVVVRFEKDLKRLFPQASQQQEVSEDPLEEDYEPTFEEIQELQA